MSRPEYESSDSEIADILASARVIALVGASDKPTRPSHGVMGFLLSQGYHVIPVNPVLAGQEIHGQTVVATLADIKGPIDIVDIFRNSKDAADAVNQAIEVAAGAVWMQLGVVNEHAARAAHDAGLGVVMDRCPAIEIPRLGINPVH
ncbi:MAG: CoA-binding protein [Sphingobium sp.]|nr:CoA-binding protein [Sphingobium sp.]